MLFFFVFCHEKPNIDIVITTINKYLRGLLIVLESFKKYFVSITCVVSFLLCMTVIKDRDFSSDLHVTPPNNLRLNYFAHPPQPEAFRATQLVCSHVHVSAGHLINYTEMNTCLSESFGKLQCLNVQFCRLTSSLFEA